MKLSPDAAYQHLSNLLKNRSPKSEIDTVMVSLKNMSVEDLLKLGRRFGAYYAKTGTKSSIIQSIKTKFRDKWMADSYRSTSSVFQETAGLKELYEKLDPETQSALKGAKKIAFSKATRAKFLATLNEKLKERSEILNKKDKTPAEKKKAGALAAKIIKESLSAAIGGSLWMAIPIPGSGIVTLPIFDAYVKHLTKGKFSIIPDGLYRIIVDLGKEEPDAKTMTKIIHEFSTIKEERSKEESSLIRKIKKAAGDSH